jgi:hypothetical protein
MEGLPANRSEPSDPLLIFSAAMSSASIAH